MHYPSHPSSIWCRGFYPQPLGHELSALTLDHGFLPTIYKFTNTANVCTCMFYITKKTRISANGKNSCGNDKLSFNTFKFRSQWRSIKIFNLLLITSDFICCKCLFFDEMTNLNLTKKCFYSSVLRNRLFCSLKITIDHWYRFSDPPVVSLTLGSKLDASDIKEGDDVYFECKIKSHPKVQKVTWKKDVSWKYFFFN